MATTPPSPIVSDKADFNKSPYSTFPYSTRSEAASKPYVVLRSPASSTSKLPATSPQVHLSKHQWRLSHSSRTLWSSRRNVQLLFKPTQQSTLNSESVKLELLWSWQELAIDKVETLTQYPEENIAGGWALLGTGKEGSLESWMIETEYGIEDGAGEIRADWRPRWLVLYFPPTSLSPAGIDIFSDRIREDPSSGRTYVTYDETIRQIRDRLLNLGDLELGNLSGKIVEVRNDGDRSEEGGSPSVSVERIWRAEDEPQQAPRGFCGMCVVQ